MRYPAVNNFLLFFCSAMPLSYFLAFKLGWGLAGLWFGLVCGMAMLDFGNACYVWGYLDWSLIAEEARKRALDGSVIGSSSSQHEWGTAPPAEGDRVGLAAADSAAARHAQM